MYVLVSDSHIVDTDRMRLIPVNLCRAASVVVPAMLWCQEFITGKDSRAKIPDRRTHIEWLNNCVATRADRIQIGNFSLQILNWGNAVSSTVRIEIFGKNKVSFDVSSDTEYPQCIFTIIRVIDEVFKMEELVSHARDVNAFWFHGSGYCYREVELMAGGEYPFGLTKRKFTVKIGSHELNGTCYAYLCGVYAILLDDKLNFDSLVVLSMIDDTTLYCEKIIYSLNTYVIKAMYMWQ